MGLPKPEPIWTVQQYLAMERAAKERHEYVNGEIYAMAGESNNHAYISVNLVISLGSQLKGKPCHARTKDTKVRSGPIPRGNSLSTSGLFSYPDALVICGEPEFHDDFKDVILNPTAIFEVLSPSTEARDRGTKFKLYQDHNPTLQEYVLIAQDAAEVEHYSRRKDDEWSYRKFAGLKASFKIASIGCTLKLSDLYERVTFPKVRVYSNRRSAKSPFNE